MRFSLSKRPLALVGYAWLATIIIATSVWAQTAATWPAKPVRVIVSFPPGGAADQIARIVAQPLQEALG